MTPLSDATQLVLMISAGVIGGLVLCYGILAGLNRRRSGAAAGSGLQALTDVASVGGVVFASSSLLGPTSSPNMGWAAPSAIVVHAGAFWLALGATLLASAVAATIAYRLARRRREEVAPVAAGPTASL